MAIGAWSKARRDGVIRMAQGRPCLAGVASTAIATATEEATGA